MTRPVYSVTTPAVTAALSGAAYACLKAGAAPVRVRMMTMFNTAAVLADIKLVRMTGAGATPTTVTPSPNDPADRACLATLEKAWGGSAPTFGTTDLHNISIASSIATGMAVPWQPDGLLVIPANGGLVLVNNGLATGPAFKLTIEFSE